jgi:hypothetical protein
MPLAKALYSYLDKRAWRRGTYADQVSEDLVELRERFRLGVRRTDHLLQEFRRAHDDLRAAWPLLREARLEKITSGRYRAVYVFTTQVSLPLEANGPVPEAAQPPPMGERPAPTEDEALLRDLTFRGLNKERARHLVRNHDVDRIRLQLDIHDQEIKQRSDIEKPAAWLYLRISENWEPFEGYKSPAERHRAAKQRQDQVEKERAQQRQIEAERAAWEALAPEERAAKRTERWAEFRAAIGKPLTDHERQALHEKHLTQEMEEIQKS